uniref:Zinc finger GRF-type domain-containing protein n=1 Tax=Brassica oleracea var. oleracea TaxID=109376 RepID=A0A0D3E292_BRAOL
MGKSWTEVHRVFYRKENEDWVISLNRAVGESPHETSSSHVERSYWLVRRALLDTRESPHFLLSPKKLGFAIREAIFVATPIQSSIFHQIDDVVRSHRAEMDPAEERRHSKKQKDHCNMLGFVADSQYGVPRRCACGGRIIDEVRGKEDYDSLTGKRFFTCVNYEDDGLHYRHPWVVGVQEENKRLSKRLHEAEQVMKGCIRMDPAEERRHSKKQKDHCNMLGFVADSQYGVPRRCACGGRIIDEVRGKEDYDSLTGKRFFTCVNYE